MKSGPMSWEITPGAGPLVVTAIHAGHTLSPEVAAYVALDDAARLREEDPYTDQFTALSTNRIVMNTSRFEVDLNRPLHRAVYLEPEDAWGLTVWNAPLPNEILFASRAKWRQFYTEVAVFLDALRERFDFFVVLDIHSYCHRRGGPDAPVDDPRANPDINLGTASVDRATFGPLIDRMMKDLGRVELSGRPLDVRENVKFTGGYFSRWINARYGASACAIAIEFKKIFMDEWTGVLDPGAMSVLEGALDSSLRGVREQLEAMGMMDEAFRMPVENIPPFEACESHVER